MAQRTNRKNERNICATHLFLHCAPSIFKIWCSTVYTNLLLWNCDEGRHPIWRWMVSFVDWQLKIETKTRILFHCNRLKLRPRDRKLHSKIPQRICRSLHIFGMANGPSMWKQTPETNSLLLVARDEVDMLMHCTYKMVYGILNVMLNMNEISVEEI